MIDQPPTLQELVELVKSRTNGGNELARLAEAAALSQELSTLTDQLLDHFVQQARESGTSWSQIGQRLGVSKQGAQQRFTGHSKLEDLPDQLRELGAGLEEKFLDKAQPAAGGLLQRVRSSFKPQRFTSSARQVVIFAQDEARELHHPEIGTGHVLLGLLREETGVAASTLRSVGVTLESLREKMGQKLEGSELVPSGHLPFTAGAKAALETAMTESAGLRHNYIGTEHVLLGVLKEHDTAREVLEELDLDVEQLAAEISRLLERL